MGFPEAPIPVQGHRFPLRPAFPFPLPLLLRPLSSTLPPGPPQVSPAGSTLLSPGAGAARAGLLLPGGGPGGRWLLGAGSCHRSSGRSPRVSPPGLRLPHSPPSGGSRARLSDPRKIFLLVFFPFPPHFFSSLNSSPLALGRIPTSFSAVIALQAPLGSRPVPGEPPVPPLPGGLWPR